MDMSAFFVHVVLSTLTCSAVATPGTGGGVGSIGGSVGHHSYSSPVHHTPVAFVPQAVIHRNDALAHRKAVHDILPYSRHTSKLHAIIHVNKDVTYDDMKGGVHVVGGKKVANIEHIPERVSEPLKYMPLSKVPEPFSAEDMLGLWDTDGWESYGFVRLSIEQFRSFNDMHYMSGFNQMYKFQDGWYEFIIMSDEPDFIRMFKRDESGAPLSGQFWKPFDQTSMMTDHEVHEALIVDDIIKYQGQLSMKDNMFILWSNEGNDMFEAETELYEVVGKYLGLEKAFFRPAGRHCCMTPKSWPKDSTTKLAWPTCITDQGSWQDTSPLTNIVDLWQRIVWAVVIMCSCACLTGCAFGFAYRYVCVDGRTHVSQSDPKNIHGFSLI